MGASAVVVAASVVRGVRHPATRSPTQGDKRCYVKTTRRAVRVTRCRRGAAVLASVGDDDTSESKGSGSSGSADNSRGGGDSTLAKLDSVLGTSSSSLLEEQRRESKDRSADVDAAVSGDAEEEKALTASTVASASGRGVAAEEEEGEEEVVRKNNPSVGWWASFTQTSDVYNVPLCEPKAAFALAAVHVAVFAGDYALYKLAGGSGGACPPFSPPMIKRKSPLPMHYTLTTDVNG